MSEQRVPDESPVRIGIRPSRGFAAVLVSVHVLALLAAWYSLSGWPRLFVEVGVFLSAVGCLAEVLQRSGRAAAALELHSDGRALWRDPDGSWHEGRLGGDHYLSPLLLVVELRAGEGRHKRILLFPDSAPARELRRLRVRLRWSPQEDPVKEAGRGDRNNPTAG